MYDKKVMGDIAIGNCPVLTISPLVQNNLLKMLIDVARKHTIPFQKKAASKSTGTDANVFAFADSGQCPGIYSAEVYALYGRNGSQTRCRKQPAASV